MKITKQQLRRVIREEKNKLLREEKAKLNRSRQLTEAGEYGTPEYDMALDDLVNALRNVLADAKDAGVMDRDIQDAIADALDYVREML